MGRACRGQELRLDQPVQHGQARGRAGRLRGGCRSRRHGGEGRFPRMVARVDQGARALSNAARRARREARRRARPDGRGRFRQCHCRHARRHDLDGGFAALLRRAHHRDQGRDLIAGAAAYQSDAAPALRRRRQDQSVQSSVPLLRRESRGPARGRQLRGDQGLRAGTAVEPASWRIVRRHFSEGRSQHYHRRRRDRRRAGAAPGRAAHRLCRLGAHGPRDRARGSIRH